MRTRPSLGRLHVITDTSIQNRYAHEQLAALAIAGGAETIQFRDKSLSLVDCIAEARRVKAACVHGGVTFLINDSVDAAAAVDADGVHLGPEDATIEEARRILGPHKIIGATAGSLQEVLAAAQAGADYVGFGHIFATTSKKKPSQPVGIDALREVCAATALPVIAIGGIDSTSATEVMGAGASGIAVIGAVCGAGDPTAAARELAAAIR